MGGLLLFLHEAGCDDGKVPVGRGVDVDGFEVGAFIHHGLLADAGLGFGEAVGREEVEVGVLLEPGLQVLRGNQVVGVVIDRAAIGTVKARLHLVDGEQRVGLARCLGVEEGGDGLADGVRAHQRVCGVRHQIQVGRDVGDVVGQHQVHADVIAADFGFAVADGDAVGVDQAILGQDVAGVGVDDDLVDLVDLKQGVENPAEQRLAAEVAEVLAFDAHTVGLHGQQGDDSLSVKHELILVQAG